MPDSRRAGSTVTLDIEVIQQWLDWLDTICIGESDDLLRADLIEVLTHPEPPGGICICEICGRAMVPIAVKVGE